MTLQSVVRGCALACLIALSSSCEKSPTATTTSTTATSPPSPARETSLHLHWLGKKKISADTNAVQLMQIWDLPESAKLAAQALDKLSFAPWRWLGIETNQASTNLLRPLLEDMITEESYVEVQSPAESTNGGAEMILAVRLDNHRAGLWETNFGSVVTSLTGIQPTNSQAASSNAPRALRWSLKKSQTPNIVEVTRVGDWVVISASADQHRLLDETIARIEQHQMPFVDSTTNSWLEVQADLPRLAAFFGEHLSANFPAITLSLAGEDFEVRAHCELNFPNKTPLVLDAWKIPTNMISSNLCSFTAVRGIGESLNASKFWKDLPFGEAPNQFCILGDLSQPSETFTAFIPDASNRVGRVSDFVLETNSSWFTARPLAGFRESDKFNGLEWSGLPYMTPFLEATNMNGKGLVVGGLMRLQQESAGGPPPELLPQLDATNLVVYDWEMTGVRVSQWIYMGQFLRVVLGVAQLKNDSPGLAWLKAAAPRLQFSATDVTQTAPGQLSIRRRSSIGFTGFELHLLADWLESPKFPYGLYTFVAKPEPLIPPAVPGK